MIELFKVVIIDNYDRETRADKLFCAHLREDVATEIADLMNRHEAPDSENWFVVKPQDYKLWRGMEELV